METSFRLDNCFEPIRYKAGLTKSVAALVETSASLISGTETPIANIALPIEYDTYLTSGTTEAVEDITSLINNTTMSIDNIILLIV